MLMRSQIAKEEEKQKPLIMFKRNNPSVVLTSLGSFRGLLQPWGLMDHAICGRFPGSLWALLRIVGGVCQSRQVGFKTMFTSVHIPAILVLTYMAISQIPRTVWHTTRQS